MHYLANLAKQVDKTHPGLGRPVVVAMLVVKARKMLLVVAPAGCGKSRITSFVGLNAPEFLLRDRLSIAGLGSLKAELESFSGVLVVDDIAKTQTPYARITTLTTLAELTYSHYCTSNLAGTKFEIWGFNGSALVNIQPVLLKDIMRSPEWEASMQDKSIRYYHLYRPLNPNPLPPPVELKWGIDFDKVVIPDLTGKRSEELLKVGEIQWGLARLREHMGSLLKAAAALDNRDEVNSSDFRLVTKMTIPFKIEGLVTDKTELEAKRYLNSNQLAILTEFATYGNFTLRQLARDYRLSESQAYRIAGKYAQDWVVVSKNPTTYAPSDDLREKLRRLEI
ncbi:hypothetical protein ES703_25840 [subsurface metagenome]